VLCQGARAEVGTVRESEAVRRVTRWEKAGGLWRVVSRAGSHVTIALQSCDGGEEMDRFSSTDAELLRFVGTRCCSED
jgi:hypothetical protein